MSERRDRAYRMLHRVIERLVTAEDRHLASKSPQELLAHFGIKIPTKCPPTEQCSECRNDSMVFVRALGSRKCMSCGFPYGAGQSAPDWDVNAPVVPTRGNRERDANVNPVYVDEPVPSEVTPLREGERMVTHKIDISQPDIRGQIGE